MIETHTGVVTGHSFRLALGNQVKRTVKDSLLLNRSAELKSMEV